MRRVLMLLGVLLVVLFLGLCSVIMGTDNPGSKQDKPGIGSIHDPPDPLPPEFAGSIPTPLSPGLFYPFVGQILSPGDTVGYTWYDYQKNCSMGRQIALDGAGGIHFGWMNTVAQGGNRYIDYNYKNPLGVWLGAMHVTPGGAQGGYTNIELLSDNRELLSYHHSQAAYPYSHATYCMLSIEDSTPGSGSFKAFDIPDSLPGAEFLGGWPCIAVDSFDFIHVVMRETGQREIKPFGYTRCYEDAESLKCEAPGVAEINITPDEAQPRYNMVAIIDSSGTSIIIVSSPVSNKVAIVYTKYRNPDITRVDNDVYYIESTNGGQDWINAGSFSGITKYNLTNYSYSDSERAYCDVAAAYDHNDSLHICWNTHWFDESRGEYSTTWSHIYHWSKVTGIRKITQAYWDGTNPGFWNRNLGKMSISTKQSNDYLYVTWTQFDPNDISSGGFSNGEIYASASTDGGLSWDIPVNLTNTQSNGCSPGNCESDHWSTLAEGIDDSLHIFYVNDRDAGGAPPGEGSWTQNPMLYLSYPAWNPLPHPRIEVDHSLYQSVHAYNNSFKDTSFKVINSGNAQLDVFVSSSAPWIEVISDSSFSVSAGANPVDVSIRFNASSYSETVLHDSIVITSNDSVGNDRIVIPVRGFVVTDEDYFGRELAYVANTTMSVLETNLGSLGDQNPDGGMYTFEDELYYLEDASVFLATINSNNDTLVSREFYRNHFTHAASNLAIDTVDMGDYVIIRSNSKSYPFFADIGVIWPGWWWGVEMTMENLIFQGENAPVPENVIISTINLYQKSVPAWWPSGTPPDLGDLYLGIAIDWDVPTDTGRNNYGGYDDSYILMWQRGAWGMSNYRAGLSYLDDSSPYGANIIDNPTYIWPNNGFLDAELYQIASTAGDSVFDENTDLTCVMTAEQIVGLSDTVTVKFAMAVTSEGNIELKNAINKARVYSGALSGALAGDVNNNGEISIQDWMYLSSYLFGVGPEPVYWGSGDIDGIADVNIGDLVYLNDYLFKSGPAPQTPPFPEVAPDTLITDTLYVSYDSDLGGGKYVFNVELTNSSTVFAMAIPLAFEIGGGSIECDSVSFVSTRVSAFARRVGTIDNPGQTVLVGLADAGSMNGLVAGSGTIAKMYFTVSDPSWGYSINFDTTFVSPSNNLLLAYESPTGLAVPQFVVDVELPVPVANFAGAPVIGEKALVVSFTDSSTGSIDSWYWSFGDGYISHHQNPRHIYYEAGVYDVKLIVTNQFGSDALIRGKYIVVLDRPVARFTADPTMGDLPLAVQFTDNSIGNITNWLWDFGDDSTSTLQNPIHEYSSYGTFDVSLTVTSALGSDSDYKYNFIYTYPVLSGDSVKVLNLTALPNQEDVVVQIVQSNTDTLSQIWVPLIFDPDVIQLDSVSFIGSRAEYFDIQYDSVNNEEGSLLIGCVALSPDNYLEQGQGFLANLYLRVEDVIPPDQMIFDTTTVTIDETEYVLSYINDVAEPYYPDFAPGSLYVEKMDYTPPATPQNLVAARLGDKVISLVWDEVTDPDFRCYAIYRDTVSFTPGSLDDTIGTSLNPNWGDYAVFPGQNYFYRVSALDSSWNESGYSGISYVTFVDNKPPTIILGPYVCYKTHNMVVICWNTDEPANGAVDLWQGYWSQVGSHPNFVTRHSIKIYSLSPSTDYSCRVRSTDSLANGPTLRYISFRTMDDPDTVAPQIVEGPVVISKDHNSATIEYETDEISNTIVYYGETMPFPDTVVSDDSGTSHIVTLTGLSSATEYYFQVSSDDPSSNGPTFGPGYPGDLRFEVGDGPYSVFCADLDADLDQDLAVANGFSNNISILKNNGNGTFQTAVNYTGGNSPRSVYCADLDGDGYKDLAVANFASNNVSILINNDNGTFQNAINYDVGDVPTSIFCSDLDGDIDLDCAVTNCFSENVSILKNNGNGIFQTAVNYDVGKCPLSIFSADLDGDTDLDLVTANGGTDKVSVLINNGNGTFQPVVYYAAGNSPRSVYCADLDGDTFNDLAVVHYSIDSVSILINNGNGTFQVPVDYLIGEEGNDVFCADFNGDPYPDIIVAKEASNGFSILINNGNGTFQTAVNYLIGEEGNDVFCVDLDGDTDLDAVFAIPSNDRVSLMLNNGDGVFAGALNFTTKGMPPTEPLRITSGPAYGSVTHNSAYVMWHTNRPASSMVRYGLSRYLAGADVREGYAYNGYHGIWLTGLEDSTRYYFKVRSADKSDTVWSQRVLSFMTQPAPDTTAPVFRRRPYARYISNNMVEITWSTNEPSDSWVHYGVGYYTHVLGSAEYVTYHRVVLSGLKPDTQFDYYVRSTDPSGNTLVSPQYASPLTRLTFDEGTFTTKTYPDVTAPVITSGPFITYKTHDMAKVDWTTDEPTNSILEYGQDQSYGDMVIDPEVTIDHTVYLTNLNASSIYHFRVSSMDLSYNGPTYSSDVTFTTAADVVDTDPPVITAGPHVPYLDSSLAIITWTTDEPANSYMGYELIGGLAEKIVGESYNNFEHMLNMSLASSYNVRVFSSDAYGNGPTYSDYFTITAPETPDVTAPSLISGPEVIYLSNNTAKIMWETDELSSSIVEYGLSAEYTDHEGSGENESLHVVTLTNLDSLTEYHYRIKSSDLFTNIYYGSDQTFSTGGNPDTTAPLTPAGFASAYRNESAQLTWSKNIDADLGGYNLYRGTTTSDLSLIASNVPDTSYKDQGLVNNVTYFYQISAVDQRLNESPLSEMICSKPLSYKVGDFNGDDEIDVVDVVALVNYLFRDAEGHEPLEAGNVNGDDIANVSDVVYLVNYLFRDGVDPSNCTIPEELLARHENKAKAFVGLCLPGDENTNEIEVLLEAEIEEEVAGIELDLNFDLSQLDLKEISTTSRTDGLGLYYNVKQDKVKIGMVDIYGNQIVMPGEGSLLKLKFQMKGKGAEISSVRIENAILVNISAQELDVHIRPNKLIRTIPQTFSLAQNYPNPFNARTVIRYSLPQDSKVEITIYNILGRKVKTLVNEHQQAGYKTVIWDGTNQKDRTVASGVYFYKIKAGDFTSSKKMLLLK
jgi:PKD repeat protein